MRNLVSLFAAFLLAIDNTAHPYWGRRTSRVWGWGLPFAHGAFVATTVPLHRRRSFGLGAKRKKNQSKQDAEDLNRWYDKVDEDATSDDVFWEEMERQRLFNQLGEGGGESNIPEVPSQAVYSSVSSSSSVTPPSNPMAPPVAPRSLDNRGIDATLSEYAAFMVKDNWLDEELVHFMQEDDWDEDVDDLEEQLDALQEEEEDDSSVWMATTSDEPWDHWGDDEESEAAQQRDAMDDSDFLLTDEDDNGEEAARMEADLLQRLSKLQIRSQRLERARGNPKAAAFFARPPDEVEGFDRMWVSAIDNVCFKNLIGVFRNYGVQFADNFGDWENGCVEDGLFTIEDVASFKARQVYEVTGLPCIASRTSFEVEPVATSMNKSSPKASHNSNSRIISGYRFNDIGMHVDYIVEALKPVSEDTRVTRFRTCLCYYDGEMEVFDYGVCDVDLYFANSVRTFIPVAAAINELSQTLQLTFGLEYEKWLKKRVSEALGGHGAGSVKLRDRVLKEGKVLPNDIVDVSAFMDSQVDVELMHTCAQELAERFKDERPSKILTIATTGLVIALPLGRMLQIPVVYARKQRSVVMADVYSAAYSSKTVGLNRELLVSKEHVSPDDRILIVDDFLSSGASQEALLRIVNDAGAAAVGIGVLLEKVYDAGRQSLSGFDIPIHSLCGIASVSNGVISLVEEVGFRPSKIADDDGSATKQSN